MTFSPHRRFCGEMRWANRSGDWRGVRARWLWQRVYVGGVLSKGSHPILVANLGARLDGVSNALTRFGAPANLQKVETAQAQDLAAIIPGQCASIVFAGHKTVIAALVLAQIRETLRAFELAQQRLLLGHGRGVRGDRQPGEDADVFSVGAYAYRIANGETPVACEHEGRARLAVAFQLKIVEPDPAPEFGSDIVDGRSA